MADEQPAAPVRFYVDDDARLPKTVESQLKLVRKEIGEGVLSLNPEQEFWEKRVAHQLGFIRGLERAIVICQEADKEFNG